MNEETKKSTVVGGCIQGSPSICIGNVFLVLIVTDEHCANLLPLAVMPILTCPICKQLSNPITSISPSPISWIKKFLSEPIEE